MLLYTGRKNKNETKETLKEGTLLFDNIEDIKSFAPDEYIVEYSLDEKEVEYIRKAYRGNIWEYKRGIK